MDKFEDMNAYRLAKDGLPDGAFFALAEELHGWTAEDWVWFSERYYQDEARKER